MSRDRVITDFFSPSKSESHASQKELALKRNLESNQPSEPHSATSPKPSPKKKKKKANESKPLAYLSNKTDFKTPAKAVRVPGGTIPIRSRPATGSLHGPSSATPPPTNHGIFSNGQHHNIDMTIDENDQTNTTFASSVVSTTNAQKQSTLSSRSSLQTPPPTERPLRTRKRPTRGQEAEIIADSTLQSPTETPNTQGLHHHSIQNFSISSMPRFPSSAEHHVRSQNDWIINLPQPHIEDADIPQGDDDDDNDSLFLAPSSSQTSTSSQSGEKQTSFSPPPRSSLDFKLPVIPSRSQLVFSASSGFKLDPNEIPSSQTQLFMPLPPSPQRPRIYKGKAVVRPPVESSQEVIQSSQSIEQELSMSDMFPRSPRRKPSVYVSSFKINIKIPCLCHHYFSVQESLSKPTDDRPSLSPNQERQTSRVPSQNQTPSRTYSESLFGYPEADDDLNDLFFESYTDDKESVRIPNMQCSARSDSATESESDVELSSTNLLPSKFIPRKDTPQPQCMTPRESNPRLGNGDLDGTPSQSSTSPDTSYASLPDVVKEFRDMFDNSDMESYPPDI